MLWPLNWPKHLYYSLLSPSQDLWRRETGELNEFLQGQLEPGRIKPYTEFMTHAPADTTIMIVDDKEDLRFGTRLILENIGYHVLEAASAEEALKLAEGFCNNIQLVISDIHLETMDGIELCQRLHISMPKLKVILMSGDIFQQDIDTRYSIFLQKPFLPARLLEEVNKLLS